MNRSMLHRILDVQDEAMGDQDYLLLAERFKSLNQQMLELIAELPEDQQNLIWNYISVGASMHSRILEIACTE